MNRICKASILAVLLAAVLLGSPVITLAEDRPNPVKPLADDGLGSALPAGSRDIQRAPAAPGATWAVPGVHATIQATIDAATTGDIINVAAGVYPEALLIDGKDLTITGAGAGSSFISGTAGQTQYIVRITNGAVVYLSGFTIDGTGIDRQYGIFADAGSDGDIHDNEVKNISWPGAGGLAIRRQECYIDVTDNIVYGFGRIGIYTRDDVIGNTDTGVISGNTVTGLAGLDPDRLSYGISVYSGNPAIDNNDIYDCLSGANVAQWLSCGLDVWTGSTSAITNNDFFNSEFGIVSNSASPTMSGNTFTNITDEDVRLDYFVKGNPTPHWAEYYNTIQEGIDAIPVTTYPCVVWIGIYSGGGTYAEALNVNKPCNIWGYSRAGVLLDVEGFAVNNAGVYISADDVLISGFTLEGNNSNSVPRYGVKFGTYDGCYLDDAEIRNVYRAGMDALGATNLAVSNVEAKDNGGNGLQLCDCSNVTFEDITTSNNAWGGVAIFTWGQHSPIGVTGIVFTGTNSFGETGADVGSIYLEEGSFATPTSPHPITYSTNILDGADVTVQLADVTHTLTGNSDNANNYTRFYATLADAQTAAAGTVSHIIDGRYITELAGTDLYVPANLGGVGPAVAAANSGDVVHVDAGTFTTAEQVYVDKDLTLEGAGSGLTTISPTFDTGSSGDPRGWFLVETGFDFDLSGVTLDATGRQVYQGIRNKGEGSCTDVEFTEIKFPGYGGVAIAAFGTGPVDVTNSTFSEIGRVGVLYYGSVVNVSTFSGNTYTGKGVGDWLDYALDISAGAIVTVHDNYISGCRGVASSDGSTSGAVMVTTYFGPGTEATITDNVLTDNSTGILVGYNASDVSVVEAHNNAIYGNDTGASSTAPTVDALGNWWGDSSGPYHDASNLGGLGNPVSDYILFDPWMGAENVVSVMPAYGTTNCLDPITFTFWFDHVGVDEVRGVDVTFQVDGAVVNVGTVSTDIVEGSYLGSFPSTTFYPVNNGGGEYKVTTSILGGSTGATGSGDLFTVVFTPVAEGLSAITITDLKVRDVDNVPLGAAMVGGEVRIDCTVPTMEPIAEAEGVCYNVTPTFVNFGFDDDQALDWAEYQIDAGGWMTIFTGVNVPEWNDDGWALPGFAGLSEASHTVYFRVADMAGNENGEGTPDMYSWSFIKDTVAPAAPTGFSAMPGHNKVHLAWTNPTGDASFVGVEIRLVAWGDYPEYITPPSYPADHLGGTFVTQVEPGESFTDDPRAPRDIYYYAAFSYDCAGNYSVFDAGAADRSTSYWLGDIANGPAWDGNVDLTDLVDFSITFGVSEGGGGWIPEADFGPSDDWSRFGIPLPDNVVDFEDLMIFSMNYGNVTPAGMEYAPEEKSPENLENMVAFELVPGTTDAGTVVSVIMNSRASTLKGARLLIETGDGCEIVTVTKGDLLVKRGDVFFGKIPSYDGVEICIAALGVDRPLAGSGEVAKILVKSEGSISVSLAEAEIRDIENRQFVLEGTGGYDGPEIPVADALNQNFPNPFNPATTVAFDLAKPAMVRIGIYDVSGRLVRTLLDRSMSAGSHEVGWNGTNNAGTGVPSGLYFYRMATSDGFTATRKMILLR